MWLARLHEAAAAGDACAESRDRRADNPKDNIEELTDGTNALSTQIRNALKKMDAELKQKAQEEPESVQRCRLPPHPASAATASGW